MIKSDTSFHCSTFPTQPRLSSLFQAIEDLLTYTEVCVSRDGRFLEVHAHYHFHIIDNCQGTAQRFRSQSSEVQNIIMLMKSYAAL